MKCAIGEMDLCDRQGEVVVTCVRRECAIGGGLEGSSWTDGKERVVHVMGGDTPIVVRGIGIGSLV